jgi:monoamine oxidase
MGDKAKNYTENGFSKGQILELLIDELDKHFDGNASATILDFEYLDWANVEYIEGAYSYASIGSHKLRKHLARPIDDKIFFAGEATHTQGHFATVHGALETAERAVEEINENFIV